MPEFCMSCKKSKISDHSEAELAECAINIIKDMRRDLKIQERRIDSGYYD